MKKPTQMEAFKALWTIAAADGRGEALFGDCLDAALDVYQRTLIGDGYPSAYLEFPLLGAPCIDLLSVHRYVQPGSRFAPYAGFGQQAMFDWFSSVSSIDDDSVSCGLELDLSAGEAETAGVYLQYRRNTGLVASFLEAIGEGDRIQSHQDVVGRMPDGWPPAYVGLFPGRPGAPMRIGGYMDEEELARCTESPEHLSQQFQAIGFEAYDAPMLERCAQFMRHAPAVDFQFDIMPNGHVGNTFGLSLSFNETKPREACACMESGYGAGLMRDLQSWGLADGRWKLIPGAVFARHVGYEGDDGKEHRFALCVQLNYAKVKFKACKPQPAKFYLICTAGDIEA